MKQKISYTAKRLLAALLIAVMLVPAVPSVGDSTVYAASVSTFSTKTKQIVCGKKAKIKLPSGYSGAKFTSSNKKVATVTSKGVIKAVRLGVAKITATSGSKKSTYTITVTPAKKSEVWLNQEAVLTNQKFALKLASDKYDTSQVTLKFRCGFDEVSSKGKCSGIKLSGWGSGSLSYSYGSFKKETELLVYTPDEIFDEVLNASWDSYNVYADTPYKVQTSLDDATETPGKLRKLGIDLRLDGSPMPDTVTYTPGDHTLTLVSGSAKYEKKFSVSYTIKDALEKRDATGYSEDCKQVLEEAFRIVDSEITDGMSDEEKVKKIHDYLIYNANYYNDGNYENAENWAYGAEGVLLHGEGVCQSYAIAFSMLCASAGVPCKYVSGIANGGGHAWNRVCIDGSWYYIDCTWDDPIMNGKSGGGERYTYYLSPTLWDNHTLEEEKDLSSDSNYLWENYYLTGEKY